MIRLIGFVSYGGGSILAELVGRNTWRVTAGGVDDLAMARSLAALYDEPEWWGPSAGRYGEAALTDLANRMNGAIGYDAPPGDPRIPN